MEDSKILDLYWARDELAISETDAAYGKKLHNLAGRIVPSSEDAQECVNDTYLKAWNTIPPQRPLFFFAYLAKICRHFAFGILDWNNALKRKADLVELTDEMQLCIPDRMAQARMESRQLAKTLNRFLESLPRESRMIFLRRYWYTDSIAEIARRYNLSESNVKIRLHRIRGKLQDHLENEGIDI